MSRSKCCRVGDALDLLQRDNFGNYLLCVTVVELLEGADVRVRCFHERSYDPELVSTEAGQQIVGSTVQVFRAARLTPERITLSMVKPRGGLGRGWEALAARPAQRSAIDDLERPLRQALSSESTAWFLPRYNEAVVQGRVAWAATLLKRWAADSGEQRKERSQRIEERKERVQSLNEQRTELRCLIRVEMEARFAEFNSRVRIERSARENRSKLLQHPVPNP